ncbi:MAG TPA: CcmD family protein [Terriglobales bacterium]|jgi:CcmD family protein|nr:CcmD family protein [Terriglobales bacterium]
MKSESYLYLAYVATWVIHIAYLSTLVRRYGRLKREIAELERSKR